ncbi:MAG TPA: dihydropteroate synthase [Acidimicrobiia bacterium]|nr:dihydropteroate synthase [Acidimicrobiia bacterium]
MTTPGPVSLPLADGGTLEIKGVLVMGVLNATPDSFSDGGEIDDPFERARRIDAMMEAGVDTIDIGGESSRPGHTPVPADEEISRVLPIIDDVRGRAPRIPISIDTRKAIVARQALDWGASFVNDVSSLSDPSMGGVVSDADCAYVAMRHADCADRIVDCCRSQLIDLIDRARQAGISESHIVVDPGLGFAPRPGPSVEDNLALIDGVADYALGRPVLVGASRKRFVQRLAAQHGMTPVEQSVDLAVRAARAGASIVRVHDVKQTIFALAEAGLRPTG